ncbi:MAG: CoA transferase, partial [Dehalococcoidia bacterium]
TTGGDYGRRLWREPDGFSTYFEALNRGKRSVCINLRQDEGRAVALQLGSRSDVVVENFRPGTMEGWGLGYEEFKAVNPRIIFAEATGWGTKGPMARYPSFDQIAQAYSGFAYRSGGGAAGTRPEVPFPGLADQVGAMNLAFGIMTALYVREHSGIGQKVEVSLLGSQVAMQAPDVLHSINFKQERPREFRASPTAGHYVCADGRWVMMVIIDQKFWPRVCRALAIPELEADERFAKGYHRWVNRELLEPLLEARFAEEPSARWLERLRAEDVPCALVQTHAELAGDEQLLANGYLQTVEHPDRGPLVVAGPQVALSATPAGVTTAAPRTGEHTDEILGEAGLSDEEIAGLRERGVVA